jgi:CheY-like chemotaxis protein
MGTLKRVLVVDDEEIMRELMGEIFKEAGFDTVLAASGTMALEIMRNDPVWIIFSDLKMPRMNGNELSTKIGEEWPMAIRYAVTGYSSLFELSDCREAGFEDYFHKPIDKMLLRDAANYAYSRLLRWKKK